jgi:UDP-2-acetamido-3-amino-2,3-dideoxy-glucuronate N-acetyltransferase
VLATPAELHARHVEAALNAGKDVFVEKPLALSLADAERLVALANEKKQILMVGHLLWYHPAILRLKELIDSGELGRIQYIYSHRLNIGKIRREENILWSFAPHDVSVILGLLDEVPDTMQAMGGNYLSQSIADVTMSTLSFPGGVRAHIFVSWLHPFKEQKLVVVGSRKMAVFDDLEEKKKLVLYPHTIVWKHQVPIANKADAQEVPVPSEKPLLNECSHFLDCIRTRSKPRTDGRESLRVLGVLAGCQAALESGLHPAPPASPPAAKLSYSVHASACVDDGVEIGAGSAVWHFSHVLKGSRIGKQCKIGQNVVIGPNAVIGDFVKIQNNISVYEGVILEDHVFCGPSMVFTNVMNPRSEIPRMHELRETRVKRGATLGANSTIVCGTTIGAYAFIGAGSVVIRDVLDYALMVGNPARQIGWMCACGIKLAFEKKSDKATCSVCGKQYQKQQNEIAPCA